MWLFLFYVIFPLCDFSFCVFSFYVFSFSNFSIIHSFIFKLSFSSSHSPRPFHLFLFSFSPLPFLLFLFPSSLSHLPFSFSLSPYPFLLIPFSLSPNLPLFYLFFIRSFLYSIFSFHQTSPISVFLICYPHTHHFKSL